LLDTRLKQRPLTISHSQVVQQYEPIHTPHLILRKQGNSILLNWTRYISTHTFIDDEEENNIRNEI